ncbi:MAG: Trm112 family protein [Planctomycetes bacterium]|nr:Trm112 family protein [Planctomycetota bacterium]
MVTISAALLAILACPVPECHGDLVQRDERLVCERCGRRYRIEESWPVLIPEEAELPGSSQAGCVPSP